MPPLKEPVATAPINLTEPEPSIDASASQAEPASAVVAVLVALSISHMLNDIMQSLLPAIYPILQTKYSLSFFQVGLITFIFQLTASLLQPLVGIYTDRQPRPYSLPCGMASTLCGLILLATAGSFGAILFAAAMVGIGSSVFHPEASRVARLASGGRYGFAQSLFQVGGNCGTALGPLLAAFVVVPFGQRSIAWFTLGALLGIFIMTGVGRWYQRHIVELRAKKRTTAPIAAPHLSPTRVRWALAVLLILVFSKHLYLVSLSTYYTLYLINHFGVTTQQSQIYLFVFLAAVAAGTIGGGPLGDRIGFRMVIWVSILGVLPFTLVLPHANLFWTVMLTVPIGLVLASAFPAIIVFAQELLPNRVGMVAGLFFGFAFGIAGVGAALLGWVADQTSIEYVYRVCAFLPAAGLLTVFLPTPHRRR